MAVEALEAVAPDMVRIWRALDDDGSEVAVRALAASLAGIGAVTPVGIILPQLAATVGALTAIVSRLPDEAFALPGGEDDWTVTQAVGHVAEARAGLVLAASLAARDRWPRDAPPVMPGIPGPTEATREQLLHRLATSQRLVVRSAQSVAGHELDPCPLVHPWVGRLRCGEWVLFTGVHDLMHIEQLERLERGLAS